MKTAAFSLTICAAVGFTGACTADDMVAAQLFEGTKVGFLLKGPLSNATLSVSGPNDLHASTFSEPGAVAIDLGKFGALDDGVYNYQITAATDQPAKVRSELNNGRDAKANFTPRQGVAMSGTFVVKGGRIVVPAVSEKEKESRRDEPAGGGAK